MITPVRLIHSWSLSMDRYGRNGRQAALIFGPYRTDFVNFSTAKSFLQQFSKSGMPMDRFDRVIIHWIQFAKDGVNTNDCFHFMKLCFALNNGLQWEWCSRWPAHRHSSNHDEDYWIMPPSMAYETCITSMHLAVISLLPCMPNRIFTALDFSEHLPLFIVDGWLIVHGKATASCGHVLMRRIRMTDEERSKTIEELQNVPFEFLGRAR